MRGVGVDGPFLVGGTPGVAEGVDSPSVAGHVGMWHVTLTVGGEPVEAVLNRGGLERLTHERPFLLSARYAPDRAEVRDWEEARDVDDAAALALRLWGEHRLTAGLPSWRVTGLEVVDRATFQRRAMDSPAPALVPAGGVRPF
jgi:hypothetical protein